MREVAVLGEREGGVTLKRCGHLIHKETRSQLAQHFHKHNRAYVLKAFGGVLGNGDEPLPFPAGGNRAILPHPREAFIRFRNHFGLAVLDMLILKPGGTSGRIPLFRLHDCSKLLKERGASPREQLLSRASDATQTTKCEVDHRPLQRECGGWRGSA